MEPNEFYVYKSGYFICGGCGGSLRPYDFERRPYRPKVCCFNSSCSKFLHVLLLGEEARITAFDTGERALDPRTTTMQAQATTRAMAGGTPGNVLVELDPDMVDNIHNLGRPTG